MWSAIADHTNPENFDAENEDIIFTRSEKPEYDRLFFSYYVYLYKIFQLEMIIRKTIFVDLCDGVERRVMDAAETYSTDFGGLNRENFSRKAHFSFQFKNEALRAPAPSREADTYGKVYV